MTSGKRTDIEEIQVYILMAVFYAMFMRSGILQKNF